jgi:hypothetical protein
MIQTFVTSHREVRLQSGSSFNFGYTNMHTHANGHISPPSQKQQSLHAHIHYCLSILCLVFTTVVELVGTAFGGSRITFQCRFVRVVSQNVRIDVTA